MPRARSGGEEPEEEEEGARGAQRRAAGSGESPPEKGVRERAGACGAGGAGGSARDKARAGPAAGARGAAEKLGPRAGRGGAGGGCGEVAWLVAVACVLVAVAGVVLASGGLGGGHSRPAADDSAAAARLQSRERALAVALADAFGPRGSGGAAAGALDAARDTVHQVLQRRERKLLMRTIDKAVVFHFAGDLRSAQKREQTLGNFGKITAAIERFALGDFKGQTALHLGRDAGEWEHVRKLVAAHLAKHRHAVIVLHRADEAPPERLYDLEDAFETPSLQHDGGRVDSTGAIFILQTSLGADLEAHVCSGACAPEHRLFPPHAGRRGAGRRCGRADRQCIGKVSALEVLWQWAQGEGIGTDRAVG